MVRKEFNYWYEVENFLKRYKNATIYRDRGGKYIVEAIR